MWSKMFMFDFLLVGFSLAPFGVFLLFWKMFPKDRGIHPIYRTSDIETTDKRTEIQTEPDSHTSTVSIAAESCPTHRCA